MRVRISANVSYSYYLRTMTIAANLQAIKNEIPAHCKLVAVSKTHPAEAVLEAYNAGQKIFGENKVQEMADKAERLPKDIEWHLIGHLQTNKVKYIAPFVSLIQSVDSLKLLKEINKQGEKCGRIIPCLLQVHIAEEETKFGLSDRELNELLTDPSLVGMHYIRIDGLMGMATFSNDEALIRREFRFLKSLFDKLQTDNYNDQIRLKDLSMGMSGDYHLAVEEGSTMVRVGSKIFGNRNYST